MRIEFRSSRENYERWAAINANVFDVNTEICVPWLVVDGTLSHVAQMRRLEPSLSQIKRCLLPPKVQ